MPVTTLCDMLQITGSELSSRLAFLGLTEDEVAMRAKIVDVIAKDLDEIIEEFYAHLLRYAELRRYLDEPEALGRLKLMLRKYLRDLAEPPNQLDYAEARLRIGYTHERIGLKQKWYLGAYAKLFEIIANRVVLRYSTDAATLSSLLIALNRSFTFDQILAVETYYHATIQRLESSLSRVEAVQHELQSYSRLDSLTQIYNHQYLMEALEMEFLRSRRFDHAFALLFLDLDRFKDLNDRHGHAFGDRVLQDTVTLIRGIIRPADIFGRYGGEEFVIGLVECEESEALRIAERMRLKIALASFTQDQISDSVTVSIGLAMLTPQIERIETLIANADRALYQAKGAGRNQVQVYREGDSHRPTHATPD